MDLSKEEKKISENENSPDIKKLKTLCEYIIPDRFKEIADYTRFEMCFKPLFNNINNISIKSVFDHIIGKNRKYITYSRFYDAYMNYKNNKEENKDIKIFFEKIMNSILKTEINYIGVEGENEYSSQNFINDKKYSISRLTLLCDQYKKIFGIKLVYKGEEDYYKLRLGPINLSPGLDIKLGIIQEDYQLRDSITHIFGTINQNNNITFLGFKCVSGMMSCFGTPMGEGFLFGEFGKKLQCLSLNHDDNGISRLEFDFATNYLTNINFKLKKNDYNNIYFDEDLIKNENTEEYNEKIKRTQIFGKRTDLKCQGFNRAFIQTPFNYMYNDKEDNDEVDDKKTIIAFCRRDLGASFMQKTNINFVYDNVSQNAFIPNVKNQRVEFIKNPFFFDEIPQSNKNLFASNYKSLIGNISRVTGKRLSKLSFVSNKSKVKEVENNFYEVKEKLISNIYEGVREQLRGEVDAETKFVLDKLIHKKESKDDNKKKDNDIILETNEEHIEEKEEKKEEKNFNLAKFLIGKLGLKNEKLANKIIFNALAKNQKKNDDKLKIIKEEDEDNINNIKKDMDKINQEKDGGKGENDTNKNENKLINNIKLLSELNNFKVSKENNDEDNEEEEEEETEEEVEEDEDSNLNDNKNINNLMNAENDKNRMALRKDNCIKIDKWENEMDEEREKKIKAEFLELQKNFAAKKQSKYIIKSLHNKDFKNIKIYFNQKPPLCLEIWKDNKFQPDENSLFSKNDKYMNTVLKYKKISWIRPNQFSKFKNYCLFDKNGPDINHIKQGIIEDSNFLSAIGALCDKNKNYIKNLFHITEKTYEHAYGINFFINGKKKLILVDDYFPYIQMMNKNTKSITNNFCFASSFENEIWVSLLEKAWAKVKGNYNILENDKTKNAFDILTGADTEEINISRYDKNNLWDYLIYNMKLEFPICGTTKSHARGNFNLYGLTPQHGYTILKLFETKNVKNVLLRDPYGTDKLGSKCKIIPESKGMFEISYDDFLKYFDFVEIGFYKTNFNEYFIKISKEESKRFKVIRIINENEVNLVYFNLYQKNRKNGKFDNFYSYMMLVENSEQKNRHIFSLTSFKSENEYNNHIGKNNVKLNKGTYYLFCDINYRFFNEDKKNHGYCLRIFSTKELKCEKIPDEAKIHRITIFHQSIIDFINSKTKLNKIEDKKLDKIVLKTYRNIGKFPFDVLLFKNEGKDLKKIQITLKDKQFSFYNDDKFTESHNKIIKDINPGEAKVILIMNHNFGISTVVKSLSDLKNINIEVFDKNFKPIEENSLLSEVKNNFINNVFKIFN